MPHLPKNRFSKKVANIQPIGEFPLPPDQRNQINDDLYIYNHQPTRHLMLKIMRHCDQFGCAYPPEFDPMIKELNADMAKAISEGCNLSELRNIILGQGPSGESAPQAHARAVDQLRVNRTIDAAVAMAELTGTSLEPAIQLAADKTGLVYETVKALYDRQDRKAFAFDIVEVRIDQDEAA